MFNSPNDCFISSPSSPSGLIFNRQHHNSRYHPYSRIPTSYYPTNEHETYSYDNNNHNSTMQNYDHSIMSYDYNLPWTTTTSSSIDNEMGIEGQTTIGSNLGGTGRVKFPCFSFVFEHRNFFIH
jgi:hypothetical protein